MTLYGWRESVDFDCENCGEDVHGWQREDVYCKHCGHVNMYEPSDVDYDDIARWYRDRYNENPSYDFGD